MKNEKLLTLAIESSCDETSVALVLEGREILSNIISSQIDVHKLYGGVVPEIASRHHLSNINNVVGEALEKAECTLQEVDFISVTYGPGLVGAVLIGLATAKAYALSLKKPIVGVNHIQGHICANYIEHKELKPPFIALVISGGHTSIVNAKGYNSYEVLGTTRDDAVGEAFDKVARVLGLGYPGGPIIDEISKKGDENAINFKRVFLEKDSLDFSFSGIKTGVLNYINNERQGGREINIANVAASFQKAVSDVIVQKAISAVTKLKKDKLVIAGGVAANSRLREMLKEECEKKGIELYYPSNILCTDNGAMIGCAGYYKFKEGIVDGLDMDAHANLKL